MSAHREPTRLDEQRIDRALGMWTSEPSAELDRTTPGAPPEFDEYELAAAAVFLALEEARPVALPEGLRRSLELHAPRYLGPPNQ